MCKTELVINVVRTIIKQNYDIFAISIPIAILGLLYFNLFLCITSAHLLPYLLNFYVLDFNITIIRMQNYNNYAQNNNYD